MTAPTLEFDPTADGTTARLTGCPRLTEETAPAVRAAFARLAGQPGDVRLDLADVEYLTSAALVELVHLCRRVKARGGRLTVVNCRPFVREVLAVTCLDRLFEVTPASAA